MKRLAMAFSIVALCTLAGVARADDKADPTGTWKWKVGQGDRAREVTLKLKMEGDKLTGAMVGGNNETKIDDGSFKDGEISFSVTRERNGMKSTTKYSGKLSGDTIKGSTESERNGEKRKQDWEAKRSKD